MELRTNFGETVVDCLRFVSVIPNWHVVLEPHFASLGILNPPGGLPGLPTSQPTLGPGWFVAHSGSSGGFLAYPGVLCGVLACCGALEMVLAKSGVPQRPHGLGQPGT